MILPSNISYWIGIDLLLKNCRSCNVSASDLARHALTLKSKETHATDRLFFVFSLYAPSSNFCSKEWLISSVLFVPHCVGIGRVKPYLAITLGNFLAAEVLENIIHFTTHWFRVALFLPDRVSIWDAIIVISNGHWKELPRPSSTRLCSYSSLQIRGSTLELLTSHFDTWWCWNGGGEAASHHGPPPEEGTYGSPKTP